MSYAHRAPERVARKTSLARRQFNAILLSEANELPAYQLGQVFESRLDWQRVEELLSALWRDVG